MTTMTRRSGIKSWKRLSVSLCASVMMLLTWTGPMDLNAQDMGLPMETQWSLFDRVVAFDRNFQERSQDEIVIGVLHQTRYRSSVTARDELYDAARDLPGRFLSPGRLRFVSIEATTPRDLTRLLDAEGVDVLYVTPLRALDVSEVAKVASDLGVVTLTGVREYMEHGIGIGFGLRGGRPEILVNLDVCREVGMDLSSELLKLVTVMTFRPDYAGGGASREEG